MTVVTFHRQIVLIIFTLHCGDRRTVLVDINLISLLSQFSSLSETSDYCLFCHNGNKKEEIKLEGENKTVYSRKSQFHVGLDNRPRRHVYVYIIQRADTCLCNFTCSMSWCHLEVTCEFY
jgi:hypothetical protein